MRVYLDHAATTPLDKSVLDAMTPYFIDVYGNPSSLHGYGREALSAVDEARAKVATILNAKQNEVYFTSGGSESDNWALRGVACANKNRGKHIVTTSIEHPAVLETARSLEKEGYEVTYLPVDRSGRVKLSDVESAIKKDTVLVSVMYVNNEIGSVQPISEIGALCEERGILFHVDAVQAVGAEPIDVRAQNVDLMSVSAHKFYGPKGVGVLYIRSGVKCDRLVYGGAQERGYRAGTTNVPAVVGLAKALEEAVKNREINNAYVSALRDRFERAIKKEIPFCEINGGTDHRSAAHSNVYFADVNGKSLLIGLDLDGIAVSTGSACTSGDVDPSHVLLACGYEKDRVLSSVRFSFGKDNTEKEIDYVVESLKKIVTDQRKCSDLFKREKGSGTSI